MPEDSTRRLLRVFGIAVTDCEDALGALETALRDAGSGVPPVDTLENYARASGELEARWTEVGRMIQGYQARGREALMAALRARGIA
jgi:hypothetical protein